VTNGHIRAIALDYGGYAATFAVSQSPPRATAHSAARAGSATGASTPLQASTPRRAASQGEKALVNLRQQPPASPS
jgi:hypothetical protein